MTKHSTLTNADDLHYAKVRTFTGSPSLVTPDFIDQILIDSDTNTIYRSLSLSIGGLIALGLNSGGGGGSQLVITGYSQPDIEPEWVGQLYFSLLQRELYCASRGSINGWIPIAAKNISFSFAFQNLSTIDSSAINIDLYHSDSFPYEPFDFTLMLETSLFDSPSLEGQFSEAILSQGRGFFTFGCSNSADGGNIALTTSLSAASTYNENITTSFYGSGLTANGLPISGTVIQIDSYPRRPTNVFVDLILNDA